MRDGPLLTRRTTLRLAIPRAEGVHRRAPQPRPLRAFRRGARATGLRAPASLTGGPGTPPRARLRVRAYGSRPPHAGTRVRAYGSQAPRGWRSRTRLRQPLRVCLRPRARPACSVRLPPAPRSAVPAPSPRPVARVTNGAQRPVALAPSGSTPSAPVTAAWASSFPVRGMARRNRSAPSRRTRHGLARASVASPRTVRCRTSVSPCGSAPRTRLGRCAHGLSLTAPP